MKGGAGRGRRLPPLLCATLGAAVLAGCEPRGESPTSGQVAVEFSDSVAPIAQKEVEEFLKLYPKTSVTTTSSTSREAVVRLLRGEVKTVFVSREMDREEKASAAENKIRVESYRFAMDGVAVLVNAGNPVARLTLEQVGGIFGGRIKNWREVGGENLPILPIVLSLNAGSAQLVLERAVKDTVFAPGAYFSASSSKVVEMVGERPDGIGFAGLAWMAEGSPLPAATRVKAKVLELGTTAEGRFFAPYQAAVYRRDYPLSRDLYILSTDRSLGVATGLISFVTSSEGQKIILDAGLVPATVPVRLVHLRE